jgi:hypothetical protein
MTRFFVDVAGRYLGGFDGPEEGASEWLQEHVPAGAIEILEPPTDGRQLWDGTAWLALVVPPPTMTPLEFIDRLNDAEQLTLATAAMTQPTIKLWYDKLLAADTVNLGDARLAAGVQAMVAAGLLAPARALAILGQS